MLDLKRYESVVNPVSFNTHFYNSYELSQQLTHSFFRLFFIYFTFQMVSEKKNFWIILKSIRIINYSKILYYLKPLI